MCTSWTWAAKCKPAGRAGHEIYKAILYFIYRKNAIWTPREWGNFLRCCHQKLWNLNLLPRWEHTVFPRTKLRTAVFCRLHASSWNNTAYLRNSETAQSSSLWIYRKFMNFDGDIVKQPQTAPLEGLAGLRPRMKFRLVSHYGTRFTGLLWIS